MRERVGGRLLAIRIACINAPEIAQKPYGARAREALQQLAAVGLEVTLEVQITARYGRSVADVFRGEENVNLWPSPNRFKEAKNIPPNLKKQLGL